MSSRTPLKSKCFFAAVWFLSLLGTWFVPVAWCGTVVEVKTIYFEEARAEETATIYLDDNRVRFDAIEGGRRLSVVFRLDEQGEPVCWVIEKEKGTYIELNREIVAEIRSQVARTRQMFEEQMNNAPPERREQMKRAMEAELGSVGGKEVDVQFKKIAAGIKLKNWDCTQYEAYIHGQKQEDLWTASETSLGLRSSDLLIFREMGVLFSGVSSETNAFFQIGRDRDEGGFGGFPVVVVEYRDGKKKEKSEVTSVRDEKLDPSVFELPEGVKRQKLLD